MPLRMKPETLCWKPCVLTLKQHGLTQESLSQQAVVCTNNDVEGWHNRLNWNAGRIYRPDWCSPMT